MELVSKRLRSSAAQPPTAVALLFKTLAGHYWPSSDHKSPEFQARYPDPDLLVAMARQTLSGRIQFWQPWHMEQTHSPDKVRRNIDWTAMPNGDEEWSHALVRFTHMVDLAAAYRMTGERQFLDTYKHHLHEFFRARCVKCALWDNQLDASIRLLNLIKSYDLIRTDDGFSESDHAAVLTLSVMEANLLDERLGTRVGNWEFFVTTSLICTSIVLARIVDTDGWRKRALARLQEIMKSEILSDGNLIEQVPMYHGECVLTLLDCLVAQRANGEELVPEVVASLRKMTLVLKRICDPNGKIPPIGDSDCFDVNYVARYCDAVLGTSFTNDIAQAGSELVSDNVTVERLDATGWTIVRWLSASDGEGYLLMDSSGKPKPGREGHSHADDLQFIFHTSRANVLVDPGRFTYAPIFMSEFHFLPWRLKGRKGFQRLYTMLRPRFRHLNDRNWCRYFRHTLRHNTVSRGGANQVGYDDSPKESVPVICEKMIQEGPLVFCRITLDSSSNYSHTRDFICHAPHLLIVIDRLCSSSQENWISSFHLGAEFQAELMGGMVSLTSTADGRCHFASFAEALGSKLTVSLDDDWVSPVYNSKLPSKTIRLTVPDQTNSILVSVFTLESQVGKLNHAPIEIEPIGRSSPDEPNNLMVHYRTPTTEIVAYLSLSGGILKHESISTDSCYAAICKDKERNTRIGFLRGSYIEIGRNRFSNSPGKASLYQALE